MPASTISRAARGPHAGCRWTETTGAPWIGRIRGRGWVHSGFGSAASHRNDPSHRITGPVVPQHLSVLVGEVQHALKRLRRVSASAAKVARRDADPLVATAGLKGGDLARVVVGVGPSPSAQQYPRDDSIAKGPSAIQIPVSEPPSPQDRRAPRPRTRGPVLSGSFPDGVDGNHGGGVGSGKAVEVLLGCGNARVAHPLLDDLKVSAGREQP